MRRNRSLCILAAGLLAVAFHLANASLAQRSAAGEPSPHALPQRYKGVSKTAKTKLVAVWGTPEQEPAWGPTVSFSRDGSRALSTNSSIDPLTGKLLDGSIVVWDVAAGKVMRAIATPGAAPVGAILSADGRRAFAATTTIDEMVQQHFHLFVVDTHSGKMTQLARDEKGIVFALALTPDGKRGLSGAQDGTIKVWDLDQRKEALALPGNKVSVLLAALSPDGKFALVGTTDNVLRLFDLLSGKELKVLTGNNLPMEVLAGLAFSEDGKRALSAATDSSVKVWDMPTGKELRHFKPATSAGHGLSGVRFSADGKRILQARSAIPPHGAAAPSGALVLWDVDTGKELWAHKIPLRGLVPLCFIDGGKRVLAGGGANPFLLLNAADGKQERLWGGHKGAVISLALTADGKRVFSGSLDGMVKAWDAPTGRELWTLRAHDDDITALAVSADGKQLITASADKTLKLWDTTTRNPIRIFKGHTDNVTCVALSADGKLALSGSGDRLVKLWEVATGKELRSFSGHSHAVTSVALSRGGGFALSGSEDGTLKLWDLGQDKKEVEPLTLEGHKRTVTSVVFSADARRILSGSQDQTVKLWDAVEGKEIRTFRGHKNWVNLVALSPDGKLALSAGDDLAVKLWNINTGNEVDHLDLGGAGDFARSLAFAPDGRSFLIGSASWVILRFELTGK
ncbi:MAG TPA: WD40 repeat domain-containing protein [Gemmataceae bacterium]|nr:WD40 repeat domain-containing protein [Gemmataceae bacterium]